MFKEITNTAATNILPPLSPIVSPWMEELIDHPVVVNELLEKYGSPINIHHLTPFHDNYHTYKNIFESFDLRHKVMFARKANKCKEFVKAAKESGFGVDTASYKELEECLEIGVPVENIVVTAAVKNDDLLRLAIANDVLVILDNEDECNLTKAIAKELNKKAKIGIRISGFHFQGDKLYSRFGFDIDTVFDFIKSKFGKFNTYSTLEYCGLHFHLNGYSTEQRGTALLASLGLAEKLSAYNFQTQFIDMGGGLLMNYLENKSEWEDFENTLKAAVKGQHDPITFKNNGLGYEMIDGELKGKMKVYPYYNDNAKANFLRNVLTHKNEQGQTAAEIAKAQNIELRIEPGRSMLDQTGITVAKVAFRKQDSDGEWLVGLEMNMTQMHSSSADFLLDPKVIFNHPDAEANPVGVYFTGAYCLERDILLQRKIQLPQLPAIGDIILFLNTAGYMMHFFESEAHLFDLAKNVILKENYSALSSENFKLD